MGWSFSHWMLLIFICFGRSIISVDLFGDSERPRIWLEALATHRALACDSAAYYPPFYGRGKSIQSLHYSTYLLGTFRADRALLF